MGNITVSSITKKSSASKTQEIPKGGVMAVKQVERRFCDFCNHEASANPCLLCHKDVCYDHGDTYRPGDRQAKRPRFDLCDECAKDVVAKLSQVRREP